MNNNIENQNKQFVEKFNERIESCIEKNEKEIIQSLIEKQNKIEEETNKKLYFEALTKAQKEFPPIYKNKKAKFATGYADLSSIADGIIEPLMKNGITVSFNAKKSEQPGFVQVIGKLTHSAGHTETTILPISIKPDKQAESENQGIASALTYGRRYILSIMTMIIPIDDGDGKKEQVYPANIIEEFANLKVRIYKSIDKRCITEQEAKQIINETRKRSFNINFIKENTEYLKNKTQNNTINKNPIQQIKTEEWIEQSITLIKILQQTSIEEIKENEKNGDITCKEEIKTKLEQYKEIEKTEKTQQIEKIRKELEMIIEQIEKKE